MYIRDILTRLATVDENMRPSGVTSEREVYECYSCGRRFEAPESRYCGTCGSEVRNIGRSRDL